MSDPSDTVCLVIDTQPEQIADMYFTDWAQFDSSVVVYEHEIYSIANNMTV